MAKQIYSAVLRLFSTLVSYSTVLIENTTLYLPQNSTISTIPTYQIPALNKLTKLSSMATQSLSFPQTFFVAEGSSIQHFHIGPSMRVDLINSFMAYRSNTTFRQISSSIRKTSGFKERLVTLRVSETEHPDYYIDAYDIDCSGGNIFEVAFE